MGLLKKASGDGNEPEYTFIENTQRIKMFLEDES
jgi:hypothetical protein